MTPKNLAEKLAAMTDDELAGFIERFGGGGGMTRKSLVDHLVGHPGNERRMAHLLGLPTEDEKLVSAAQDSAEAAKGSALAARESARTARLSMIVALAALVLSGLTYLGCPRGTAANTMSESPKLQSRGPSSWSHT